MELGMDLDFSDGEQSYVLSPKFMTSLFGLKFFEEISFLIESVFLFKYDADR